MPTIALFGWTWKPGDRRDQARGLHDFLGDDAVGEADPVGPDPHRHHDLLERTVAGALADAVDGALDLARTGVHRQERVGDGQAQIVVAMDREDRLVDVGHAVPDLADQVGELLGVGVAHRVGDVDRGGAARDGGLDAAEQEVGLGARRVHGTPLDIVGVAPRTGDAVDHPLVHLLGARVAAGTCDGVARCR